MTGKENYIKNQKNTFPLEKKITVNDVRNEIYNFFKLNGQPRTYTKNSYIFQFNDTAHEGYVVESGRVKTYKLTSEGKVVIFNIVTPGEILGVAEVLLNCPRMRYAEAICKTTLWVISNEQLFERFYSNNDLCLKSLWLTTQQLMRYQHYIEDLAILPVRDRVIKLLARLCKERGKSMSNYTIIEFPITNEEIAQMVGSSRQTISFILNELRKDGILDWEKKKIKIYRWIDLL